MTDITDNTTPDADPIAVEVPATTPVVTPETPVVSTEAPVATEQTEPTPQAPAGFTTTKIDTSLATVTGHINLLSELRGFLTNLTGVVSSCLADIEHHIGFKTTITTIESDIVGAETSAKTLISKDGL